MLGKSPYRYCYLWGRMISFTLAGTLAGAFGAVLGVVLAGLHISVLTSFLFGGVILFCGTLTFLQKNYPGYDILAKWLAPFNQNLSLALL